MKAAIYYRNGEPEVLQYEDISDPAVASTDVLIAVEAISLEGGDILTRRRVPVATPPHVVGYAAAGVVRAVGSDVTNIHICLLYTSPSPRDRTRSRMPSSA